MPILKLKEHELVAGEFYLAYSAKSKKLSRYGKSGVIVEYIGKTAVGANTIKVPMDNGKFFEMNIARLNERKDAYMLPVDAKTFADLEITVGNEGSHYPQFTPLMKEHVKNQKLIKFSSLLKPDERFPEDKRDGTATIIFDVPGRDRPLFLNNGQVHILTDVLALVCTAEELEAKKLAEAKARVAKLKEGGVKLVVGKTELGLKCLLDLDAKREAFKVLDEEHQTSCCSFTLLYGKDMDSISDEWEYGGAPCHAQLSRSGKQPAQFVLSSARKAKYSNQNGKNFVKSGEDVTWIDYLVNRSPYADVFVDKDVNAIIERGHVVTAHAPSNAVCAALTATRQAWEYAQRPAAFNLLREHLPENLAYFVCMAASGNIGTDGKLDSLTFNNENTGHTPLDHVCMSDEMVINLVYNNITLPNKDLTHGGSYYSPNRVHSLFGNSQQVDYDERNTLIKALRTMRLPAKKASDNPFDIPKSDVDRTIEQAVVVTKEWLTKQGVEL